jgi:exodeoxyribonuclease VII small subunit
MPDPDSTVAPAATPGAVAAVAPTFEQAMDRLEQIVGQMENAKLPLDDLIRCYEEGTRLVKVCNERLLAAEQRIELITRDAAGEVQLTSDLGAATAATAPSPAVRASKPAQESSASSSRSAKKSNEVSLF